MKRGLRLLRIGSILLLIPILGFTSTSFLNREPIDRSISADQETQTVALDSLMLARIIFHDHPFQRILYPAMRAIAVDVVPGSCTEYPRESVERPDFQATVRVYTWFFLPAKTVKVTCGGMAL